MPWLLNLLYFGILLLASPVLLYRMLARGKYRDGWGEKFLGRLPTPPVTGHERVWFHAVSVGEVLQLVTVVRELLSRHPRVDVVITTTTSTGLAVAKEKFPEHHVCYFPLDFSWAAANAIDRIRPDVVVLVELELWPNFIKAAHRRGIPLLLINGRISERSFRGYRKLRFLMRGILRCFDRLAVQNETYAQRLRQLGAHTDRITVTGSIKFDAIETNRNNLLTAELRQAFGLAGNETVLIAGSTHSPEEEIALSVWQQLRDEFPRLRLILVPRHKERFEEVGRLVEERGFGLLRRSEVGERKVESGKRKADSVTPSLHHSNTPLPHPLTPSPPHSVLLLDTLGELSACWGLADIAFVGGSLSSRGGQNMIEPAGYGAAVLFGPNTRNFRDVVEMLLDGNAARVVANENELTATIRCLLTDIKDRRDLGDRAKQLVTSQRGATRRTVDLIGEALNSTAEVSPQVVAA